MKSYILDITTLSDYAKKEEALYPFLSADRLQRQQRIKAARAKQQNLGAGLLLTYALAKGETQGELSWVEGEELVAYLNSSHAAPPRIRKGENGKPYLVDLRERYFNLSHSHDLVFIAVSDKEVGCDVQKMTDRQMDGVGRRFFGPEERKRLETLSGSGRQEAFFACWCAKEAFAKYTGEGLAGVLQKDLEELLEAARAEVVQFRKEYKNDTYYFALCRERR